MLLGLSGPIKDKNRKQQGKSKHCKTILVTVHKMLHGLLLVALF